MLFIHLDNLRMRLLIEGKDPTLQDVVEVGEISIEFNIRCSNIDVAVCFMQYYEWAGR